MLKQKSDSIRIGIDLMGNENSPEILVDALIVFAKQHPLLQLTLIGCEKIANQYAHINSLAFSVANDTIEMDEDPLHVIRRKKNSSIHVGIDLLKNNKIDAFVSAGNTGALVSLATMGLSLLPSILRPALLAIMPTKKKPLAVLDVGANVHLKADHLFQFAIMGGLFQKTNGIDKPVVGILNIGSEEKKGTAEIKKAYQQLSSSENPFFTFAGNIEGKQVFEGDIDVLVTDGFTGNVFLKTAEGMASLILDELYQKIPPKQLTSFTPFLADIKKRLHYSHYPGAIFLGVDKIVIKCHGYSTPDAILNGIIGAALMVEKKLIEKLKESL